MRQGSSVRSGESSASVTAVVAFSTLRVSQCTYPGGAKQWQQEP